MIIIPVIGTGICGQLLKMLFHSLRQKRWRLGRFGDFESFPSMHPFMSGSLCYQVAESTGWGSAYTAITLGFTGVILYDTSGVKRAAGQQARLLMHLSPRQSLEHRLTEFLGQSPVRTWIALISGMLMGVLIERAWLALGWNTW